MFTTESLEVFAVESILTQSKAKHAKSEEPTEVGDEFAAGLQQSYGSKMALR